MTDNIENLILEHLRALRGGQDRIEHELCEVQSRLSRLETAVIGLRRDIVHTEKDVVRQQLSIRLVHK
jgi:hypothetical protein